MSYSPKRITFGDITDILSDAAATTQCFDTIEFEQALCDRSRILIRLDTARRNIPFTYTKPLVAQQFLERVDDFLKSRDAYLAVTSFSPQLFSRYYLIGTYYRTKSLLQQLQQPSLPTSQ